MVFRFADNRDPRSWASRFRRRRMALLDRLLRAFPDRVRVLDVGGTEEFWRDHAPALSRRVAVTVLNQEAIERAPASSPATTEIGFVVGDARDLSRWPARAFDVCFSNSLLEHVGSFDDQRTAASEMRRVARGYMVQTPNRRFPIEPHFLVPGWQFLPLAWRARLHQSFTLGWMPRQADPLLARNEVAQVRLLDGAQMTALFPEATMVRESLGPLVKSWIAVYHPDVDDFPATI